MALEEAPTPAFSDCSTSERGSSNDDTETKSQSTDQTQIASLEEKVARYHHVLPPCKVCGTQATGFHYGINSCEACKGFFRRSILRKKDYRCSKSAKCLLKPGKHKLCPYCRFKRCLAVGMSVKGIKTGRYTYEKRTKDILELKLIEQSEATEANKANSDDEATRLMNIAQEVRIHADKLLSDMNAVCHIQEVEKKQEEFLRDPMKMIYALNGQYLKQATDYMRYSASSAAVHPDLNLTSLEEMNQEGDCDKLGSDCDKSASFYIRSSQRMITLNENGRSVSASDRDVKLAWFRTIEFGIRCIVRFIKAVPGFRNLHIDDQLNLIKHSFLEAWLISRHQAFNTTHQVYTAANGFTLDIGLTVHRDIFSIVLGIVRRLQSLKLNAEETYILQAIVQLFPDRCEMRNYEQIEKLQKHYITILQCLFKVNHKEDRLILPKIFGILTELRNITDVFYKASTENGAHLPLIKDSAPLLMEMVTSVRQ